jgi:hypothetical protein
MVLATACTALKPVEMAPEELREKIVSAEVVKAGYTALIVTIDGKRYEFVVQEVTQEAVVGNDTQVPIAEIVAVQTPEISVGKTAAYTYGTLWLVLLLVSVVAMASGSFPYVGP